MRLLDLLQQYPGWTFDAGGRLWSVEEYARAVEAQSGSGSRGPEVTAHPSVDLGSVAVLELDSTGQPGERLGTLIPTGKRW